MWNNRNIYFLILFVYIILHYTLYNYNYVALFEEGYLHLQREDK